MKFEEFEKNILEKDYGIVAMNHFTISGKRYTYRVVLSRNKERAFQSEAPDSKTERMILKAVNQKVELIKLNPHTKT